MNSAAGRSCDVCTACCFTHAVAGVKPGGEWCPHCEIGSGCRIYLDRPAQCRNFSCLWLKSDCGDEDDRPDRLGVVVSDLTVSVGDRRIRLVQFIETEAGAIDQGRVARLIEMYRAKGLAICIARREPSGSFADASYEIPANLLAESELDQFRLELGKLSPSAE